MLTTRTMHSIKIIPSCRNLDCASSDPVQGECCAFVSEARDVMSNWILYFLDLYIRNDCFILAVERKEFKTIPKLMYNFLIKRWWLREKCRIFIHSHQYFCPVWRCLWNVLPVSSSLMLCTINKRPTVLCALGSRLCVLLCCLVWMSSCDSFCEEQKCKWKKCFQTLTWNQQETGKQLLTCADYFLKKRGFVKRLYWCCLCNLVLRGMCMWCVLL